MEIIGRSGALFYTWVVCVCSLGSLNSIVFSTSRLTQAAGNRHYLPPFLRANKSATDEDNRWPLCDCMLRYMPIRAPSTLSLENDNIPRYITRESLVQELE